MKVALVCMGNIFRSKVLEQYLKVKAPDIEVFSCGILSKESMPEEKILMKEVKLGLLNRGLKVNIKRNPWSEKAKNNLEKSDLILTATKDIRKFLINKINNKNINTFYEFINEGEKEFEDPFDYKKRKQDPEKFQKGFDELERLAQLIANRIK